MKLPVYIQDLCQAFLNGLKAALGDNLYGVYLHGAVAFPETTNTGDIDFHVILAERLSEGEHSEIKQLHAKLADDFPPLGIGMDGYYLLLEDARGTAQPGSQSSPFSVDDAWALHRAHIRAGRCIVLHGPDPKQIYPSATWVELEADLEEQLQYVEAHLEVYPAYCILNLCRLMTSFRDSRCGDIEGCGSGMGEGPVPPVAGPNRCGAEGICERRQQPRRGVNEG